MICYCRTLITILLSKQTFNKIKIRGLGENRLFYLSFFAWRSKVQVTWIEELRIEAIEPKGIKSRYRGIHATRMFRRVLLWMKGLWSLNCCYKKYFDHLNKLNFLPISHHLFALASLTMKNVKRVIHPPDQFHHFWTDSLRKKCIHQS